MMKNYFLFSTAVLAMLFYNPVNAQVALKFGTNGGPVGNGPTTSNQVVTFTDASTGNLYSPAITVTYSLSNQQFTAGEVEGLPSNSAMNWGGNGSATVNSPMSGTALYATLSTIGSPTDAMFTDRLNATPGTGIVTTTDRSIGLLNTTDAFINSSGTNTQSVSGRIYVGDVTLTFSQPVSNPLLQITGLGGNTSYGFRPNSFSSFVYADLGFSTEFDLIGTSVSLSKLSGSTYLNVSSNSITNSATRLGPSSPGSQINGVTRYGASGTVAVTGTNITSISFRVYVRGDGGIYVNGSGTVVTPYSGQTPPSWSNELSISGDLFLMGVSFQKPVSVSGNVFNDPNAGNVDNSSGAANLVPAGMFANLVDGNGIVVATATVNTNGTYTFPDVFEGNYTVSLSTTAGVQGLAKPAEGVPAAYAITGAFNGAPNTGNNGAGIGISPVFAVGSANVTNINMGMQRRPVANNGTSGTFFNNNSTYSFTVSPLAFSGSDPDGSVRAIVINSIPADARTITINGIKYGPGFTAFPVGGVIIPTNAAGNPTQQILVDPTANGMTSLSISYSTIDNADGGGAAGTGARSLAANVTIAFILPVSFGQITADARNCQVNLRFDVLTQQNSKQFEIEFSGDGGVSWSGIAILLAKGNTSVAETYSYIHTKAVSGINLYRIKSVDRDANFMYSATVSAVSNCSGNGAIVSYPNPVKDKLTVLLPLNFGIAQVKIINATGQQVAANAIVSGGVVTINTSTLSKGMYLLQVLQDGKAVYNQKLVKD